MADPGSIPGGSTIFPFIFRQIISLKSDTAFDTILSFQGIF